MLKIILLMMLIIFTECFSACWMTLVLLGISFLVFYALGMSAYRRNSIIVIKCNNTNPASDVYYHHIVPRGANIPFIFDSGYIADMATRYPSLRFNVYLLLDDYIRDGLRNKRHGRFINKIIPINLVNFAYNSKINENNERQLREFERKYENVNVTIMPLSKFMSMTPLKYNWRSIPFSSLSFYARVFSVWQNGGIGMDLTTFNNVFNEHENVDRKILAILQQHNDGINPTEYINALNSVNCGAEIELLEIFFTFFNQVLNGTRSFFNNSLSFVSNTTENYGPINKTLNRNHRELYEMIVQTTESNKYNSSDGNNNEINNITDVISNYSDATLVIKKESDNLKSNNTYAPLVDLNSLILKNKPINLNTEIKIPEITSNGNIPHVMFYDFTILNEGLAPSYMIPEMIFQPDFGAIPTVHEAITSHKKSHFLTLDSEGTFIAASSQLHPFLGKLILSAYRYEHPKFAITDTYTFQCSKMFRNDHYCNNVFLI